MFLENAYSSIDWFFLDLTGLISYCKLQNISTLYLHFHSVKELCSFVSDSGREYVHGLILRLFSYGSIGIAVHFSYFLLVLLMVFSVLEWRWQDSLKVSRVLMLIVYLWTSYSVSLIEVCCVCSCCKLLEIRQLHFCSPMSSLGLNSWHKFCSHVWHTSLPLVNISIFDWRSCK